jgi:glycosyltransferase involved in cell wall biosynthesis
MNIDVTIVINLHSEGKIACATFESVIRSVDIASNSGLNCETIAIIDNGDAATINVAEKYSDKVRIEQCSFGDLSQSRNHGISLAKGLCCTFIDGDDIWGEEWILRSYKLIKKFDREKIIIHPQTNLFFGRALKPYFWVHPDMRYDSVSYDDILSSNRWTALSFALSDTYRKFPYHENEIDKGYGYEDWLWHIETIYHGYLHIVADRTIHFIRRKSDGSLLQRSNKNAVLPNISKLVNSKSVMSSTC